MYECLSFRDFQRYTEFKIEVFEAGGRELGWGTATGGADAML